MQGYSNVLVKGELLESRIGYRGDTIDSLSLGYSIRRDLQLNNRQDILVPEAIDLFECPECLVGLFPPAWTPASHPIAVHHLTCILTLPFFSMAFGCVGGLNDQHVENHKAWVTYPPGCFLKPASIP